MTKRTKRRGADVDIPTYTLTVTAEQAATIANACEIAARLGIGQIRIGLELSSLPEVAEGRRASLEHVIEHVQRTYMAMFGRHGSSSFGIHNKEMVQERSRQAWDIYTLIRHRLAWDRAEAEGIIGPGELRNWSEMMGASYDEPTRLAPGVATIEKVEAACASII